MTRNIKAKKLVIKVGTNILTDKNGILDLDSMKSLVSQIAKTKKDNKEVILISSGAIGAGMKELGLKSRPKDIVMMQVCAAIGQNLLMSNYYELFKKHGIKIAQILVTYEDIWSKKIYKNLHNSLDKLTELGALPIINENDPVSIDELGASFGDNDHLSAIISLKTKADLLIILTNVDGLYDGRPDNGKSKLIKEVKRVDKKIESIAGNSKFLGIGGMKTKIQAAKEVTDSGISAVIANGKEKNVLLKILNNKDVGTYFHTKNHS